MFWIISAILVAAVFLLILPTMLKGHQVEDASHEQNVSIAKEQLVDLEKRFEQGEIDETVYQASREELELSLFNDLSESGLASSSHSVKQSKVSSYLLVCLIPLLAVPIYLSLGNLSFTKEFDPKQAMLEQAKSTMPVNADGSPDIEKIAERLKLEMDANPTDPKGWYMLGRSYMLLKRYDEAAESFDKSLSLRPNSADSMLSLADALSMSNNGQLEGRPRILVNKALNISPKNITALWLSGMAASQEGDYVEAITKWNNVIALLINKPDEKAAVEGLIADAKSRMSPEQIAKLHSMNANEEAGIKEPHANPGAGVLVTVSLSDSLKDKASPDDVVFIYAKAMSGPPMPLAAVRKQVSDLPIQVMLNDDMAMMPSLKISSFNEVSIGARISKSSQPIASDGDLYNEIFGVKIGSDANVEIDKLFIKN